MARLSSSRIHPFVRSSALGAFLLLATLTLSGLGEGLELLTLDLRFKTRAPPRPMAPVLVTVLRGERVRPPGRTLREDLADLLEALADLPHAKRPDAVVVDIALTNAPGPVIDGALRPIDRIVSATKELGMVIHAGIFAYREDDMRDPPRDVSALLPHSLAGFAGLGLPTISARGVQLAHPDIIESLYDAAAGVGFISLAKSNDRIGARPVYSVPMLTRHRSEVSASAVGRAPAAEAPVAAGERIYLSLGLAGVCHVLCGSVPLERCLDAKGGDLVVHGVDHRVIPLDPTGRYWVNYRKRFRYFLGGITGEHRSVGPTGLPEVVLFQVSPGGGRVRFVHLDSTPLSEGFDLSGRILLVVDGQERVAALSPLGNDYSQSAIHGQVMSNIMESDFLVPVPRLGSWSVVLLLWLGGLYWRVRTRGPREPDQEMVLEGFLRSSLLYLRSLVLAPEPLLVAAWWALAWGLFAVESLWVPVVGPTALMIGSFVGWRWMLPRYLAREVARQKALATARTRHAQDLEQEVLALEQARDEAVRAMTVALKRTDVQASEADRAADGQKRDAEATGQALSVSVEELQELDRVLEAADETLRQHGTQRDAPLSHEPRDLDTDVLLEQIAAGKAQVRHAQAQLERVQAEIREVGPTVDQYRRWYLTWAPAYQGLVKQLQGIVNAAVDRVSELSPTPLVLATPEDIGSLEPDTELTERTGCLTCDPKMKRILRNVVERYAPLKEPVLVQGETGTGKELIARTIHRHSPRGQAGGPLVMENCANLDENLAKSRLFGHRKGAFTGAESHRDGVFVEADGGTLVLDELGELNLGVQAMLLRVLEDAVVKPLGGSEKHAQKVDVRVVASTSAELEQDVAAGRFRKDLYYRLRQLPPVLLPPLRSRIGDVPLLLAHFMNQARQTQGRDCRLTDEAKQYLNRACPWPGNVRQLKNLVNGLVGMAREDTIDVAAVREHLGATSMASPVLDPDHVFTLNDLELLALQRREGFNMSACGSADDYPGNRATADRHFRVFLCKALWVCQCDVRQATRLVAGRDHLDLAPGVESRMWRFLSNLEKRLKKAHGGSPPSIGDAGSDHASGTASSERRGPGRGRRADGRESEQSLRRSIKREYSPNHEFVLLILDALRSGRLQTRSRHDT